MFPPDEVKQPLPVMNRSMLSRQRISGDPYSLFPDPNTPQGQHFFACVHHWRQTSWTKDGRIVQNEHSMAYVPEYIRHGDRMQVDQGDQGPVIEEISSQQHRPNEQSALLPPQPQDYFYGAIPRQPF